MSALAGYLSVFYIVMMVSTVAPQPDGCIPDLTELKLRMDAEWAEVLVFNNATRGSPYRYILCPNTVYPMEGDQHQIIPVLDETFLSCGDDGKVENNCVIENRVQNETLIIPQVFLGGAFENYIRFLTVFSGITFNGSSGVSVAAWDAFPTRAIFRNCFWTGNRGLRVFDLQFPVLPAEPDDIGQAAMIVQVEDSVIENEELSLSEDKEFDSSNTTVKIAFFNQGGTLSMSNVTFQSNHLNFFIFASFATCEVDSSLFIGNQVEEGIFGVASVISVKNSRFQDNRYIVGSLSVADAGIESQSNIFDGNSGLADVVGLSFRRRSNTVAVEVDSCCFRNGNYLVGPVLVAGNGDYEYENVFVANEATVCPSSPFLESETELCFDSDGIYIQDQACQGTCDDNVAFDAPICPVDEEDDSDEGEGQDETLDDDNGEEEEEEDCVDAKGKVRIYLPKRSLRTCNWLARQRARTIRWYCRNGEAGTDAESGETNQSVRDTCPETCQACSPKDETDEACVDNTNGEIVLYREMKVSCDYFASRRRRAMHCVPGSQVLRKCPKSCNSC